MSIFFQKKKYKTEESLHNRGIDIYNPDLRDFNENNIKTIPHLESTTERKKLDMKKDIQSIENINTSVDISSNYCEENIDLKDIDLHIFKKNFSDLRCILNSKIDTTISKDKDIKNSEKDEIKKEINTPKEEKGEEKEYNIKEKSNDNINNEINQINEAACGDYKSESNITPEYSFDSKHFNKITFKGILAFKDVQYQNDFDLNKKSEIYRTSIIYNKKERNLLIKGQFLYILEKSSKTKKEIKFNNPDLSLIYQLEKKETNPDLINSLKIDYDLSHPLICLNFNLLSCKLLLNKTIDNKTNNNEIQILILGSKSKISFYIKNYEVYKRFVYIIGQKIFNSEGYKMNKMGLCLRNNNFYKDIYISTAEFESTAKTGDMLLFITMDCISDVQKFFTRDQYDHIALVVINEGELEILEATSNEKCNLLKWRRFKFNLYNLIFKKIVLRRLNIEEKDPKKVIEIRNNIEENTKTFIKKILKKEYEMSLLKMAFSAKPEEYEIKGEWEKGSGYCCSALNAAFYVYNGIMKLEKSVHSIRPGDFEQDKNRLTLMPGFSFGPEKIIEFST